MALACSHALSSSSGEWALERPGMLRHATNACSTMTLLARALPIATRVSGPILPAREERRSGDQGDSWSLCPSGMCDSLVAYCPLRPRRRLCSATTSPPSSVVTREAARRTSTCRPISACGTE